MRVYLAPKGNWAATTAGAPAGARDGDMVLVRSVEALDLAQRAYGWMASKGPATAGVRLAEYRDFMARIQHDCCIADVVPISGGWMEVSGEQS